MADLSEELDISKISGFDRFAANGKIRPARASVNAALIGNPRGTYTEDCLPPQSNSFKAMLETADVGPFTVTGLRPAVRALAAVMAEVKRDLPAHYAAVGHEGMLCCRLVRGSKAAVSNHAWGLAIDLKFGKNVAGYGRGKVHGGRLALCPIFNRHGFYWGIAFKRDDSMHFEAGEDLVRQWAAEGLLGAAGSAKIGDSLTMGDRGPRVVALQQALNRALAPSTIEEDGIFGPITRLALIDYQSRNGLAPNGLASASVLKRLGL